MKNSTKRTSSLLFVCVAMYFSAMAFGLDEFYDHNTHSIGSEPGVSLPARKLRRKHEKKYGRSESPVFLDECSGIGSSQAELIGDISVGEEDCETLFSQPTKNYLCSSLRLENFAYSLTLHFKDPIPSGTSASAAFLSLGGAYDCQTEKEQTFNTTNHPDQPIPPHIVELMKKMKNTVTRPSDKFSFITFVSLQTQTFLRNFTDIEQGDCLHPYCFKEYIGLHLSPISIYNYGGMNEIVIYSFVPICLSDVSLKIEFQYSPPEPQLMTPNAGPIEGETHVMVRTSLAEDTSDTFSCLFDGVKSAAKKDEFILGLFSCKTPQTKDVHEASLTFINDRFPSCVRPNILTFDYYDIHLSSIEPSKALTKGGERIVITCDALSLETPDVVCRFTSDIATETVPGLLNENVVTCETPIWKKEEIILVSISFNGGQQFTSEGLELQFYVTDESVLSDNDWLLIGLCSAGVVMLIFLLGLWIRHMKSNKGYKKIKDGAHTIDLKDVKLLERIGKGTFGEVVRAQWRGAIIAVKKLPLLNVKDGSFESIEKEINMMKSFRHPNVLQYLGSCLTPPDIFIALEYMSRGSLYSILHNPDITLTWGVVIHILTEASRGVFYLHSLTPPIIHRDLKSHNLLVDEAWRVKVSDFGLSTHLDQQNTMTACGTPSWTAPEVIRHSRYSEKADVYSFGIVMWEGSTRDDPYSGLQPFQVIYSVGHQGVRPSIPPHVPESYATLTKKCWSEEPEMRPSFSEIFETLNGFEKNGFVNVLSPRLGDVPSLDDTLPPTPRPRNRDKKYPKDCEQKRVRFDKFSSPSSSPQFFQSGSSPSPQTDKRSVEKNNRNREPSEPHITIDVNYSTDSNFSSKFNQYSVNYKD